ncbi:MAG: hypothetical protein H6707_17540 [Deltaproteobacteria bacterium]|nr:hypothetical protein [Deltaproteobacteria bacterium]
MRRRLPAIALLAVFCGACFEDRADLLSRTDAAPDLAVNDARKDSAGADGTRADGWVIAPGAQGAPCADNASCNSNRCAQGTAFPQGMCTSACGSQKSCPSGLSCIAAGTEEHCVSRCAGEHADCGRLGYECEERTDLATSQRVRVCIGH